MSLSRAAAIVGAAEANEIGYPETPRTGLQLHMEAIYNVSKQTGIPISDIEGVFSAGMSSEIAEHLGLHPKYIDTTAVGGCSFVMHVHHAMCAIHAGVIDIALVTHGENGWSRRKIGAGGGGGYGGGGSGGGGSTFGSPDEDSWPEDLDVADLLGYTPRPVVVRTTVYMVFHLKE